MNNLDPLSTYLPITHIEIETLSIAQKDCISKFQINDIRTL
jgi:hypothetical protein